MYYTIRIIDGEFKLYNDFNKRFSKIDNPNVTKENLKKKILEVINEEVDPIKVRPLIYRALTLLSGYETKHPCRYVLDQESNDPLYQELYQWILSLKEYQEFIKSSKRLKVSMNDFTIYDINGTISTISNEEIDSDSIEKKFNLIIADEINRRHTTKRLLKNVLSEYFDVTCCTLNYMNPLVEKWLQKISYLDIRKEVIFKDGKIMIRIQNEFFKPEKHITVDALKLQIIEFVNKNTNTVNKSEIIFSSLEELTQLKVVKCVPKYVTTYIGEKKMKKDVLVEDPLYVELCNFIDLIPEFQENRKQMSEISKKRLNKQKQNMVLIKEQKFVDQNCSYHGTHLPRRVYRY